MGWVTEEVQKVLKLQYSNYVATTNNEVKKKLRAGIIKELHQLQEKRGANKIPLSLPDDDEIFDKVCSFLKVLVSTY
jgi:hypothetical protein